MLLDLQRLSRVHSTGEASSGKLICGTVYLTMCLILINSGNIKILCMIIKMKFTIPEVEVHITSTSYMISVFR